MTTQRKPAFIAYVVTGEGKKAYWTRTGCAWQHSHDAGFNIDLSALPVNGRIVLMPSKTDDGEMP